MLKKFIVNLFIVLCSAVSILILAGAHLLFLYLVSEGHFILAGIYCIILFAGLLTLSGAKIESGQK
jgi:hypothetical protein